MNSLEGFATSGCADAGFTNPAGFTAAGFEGVLPGVDVDGVAGIVEIPGPTGVAIGFACTSSGVPGVEGVVERSGGVGATCAGTMTGGTLGSGIDAGFEGVVGSLAFGGFGGCVGLTPGSGVSTWFGSWALAADNDNAKKQASNIAKTKNFCPALLDIRTIVLCDV